MADETLLQVFDSKPEAETELHRYARLCKDKGLTPVCRVKVAPVRKHRYQGTWGIWLVKQR